MIDEPAASDEPDGVASAGGLAGALGCDVGELAELVARLAGQGLTVATAESLTAGLLAAAITEIPGSSAVLRGGIVCYATDLKRDLVGVDAGLLAERGAVDPDVARQLAAGVRLRLGASIGVGLTGVAGPAVQDGQRAGTVYVAATDGRRMVDRALRAQPAAGSSRWTVRAAAVRAGLDLLSELIS